MSTGPWGEGGEGATAGTGQRGGSEEGGRVKCPSHLKQVTVTGAHGRKEIRDLGMKRSAGAIPHWAL